MKGVTMAQAQKLIGKHIYAVHENGTTVTGKLLRISENELVLEPPQDKSVRTKAIIPLVLFSLLAIGLAPYGCGGFGGGCGGGSCGCGCSPCSCC